MSNDKRSKAPGFTVYTDGCCLKNPGGPGGWSAIVLKPDGSRFVTLRGCNPVTTNNRMEMMAAIFGISATPERCRVTVYTDSQYLKNGATAWREIWKRRGYVRVKNPDLWKSIHSLMESRDVGFKWVRGHNGDPLNEECDKLAGVAARGIKNKPIVVHPEPPEMSKCWTELEHCVDCHQPTRFWMEDMHTPLCEDCCRKRNENRTHSHD